MKKLLFIFMAFLLLANTSYSQRTAPTDHSTMITFQTVDGKARAYYIPSDSATGNALIIFHDKGGLDPYTIKEAQKWQALLGNVDVYAMDMYDGKMTGDRNMAAQYRDEMNAKHADNLINGLLAKIGRDKRIVTLGWGIGGNWAFRTAVLAGNQTAGCIMYYSMPEKEDKNIRGMQGDVLYNWAAKDKMVQKAFVDDFGHKVEANKHKFEFHSLDADNGFAHPTAAEHNELATVEADRYSLVFMKAKFQVE